MTLLALDHVGFRYTRQRPALEGVSFTLTAGASLGLVVGPPAHLGARGALFAGVHAVVVSQ